MSGLFLCDGFEIAVDLFLVLGRSLVVDAGSEAVLRLFRLDLLAERRFGALERLRRLPPQVLPSRVVLLEGFGAGRRQRHAALVFEREARAAAGERLAGGILFAQLLEQLPCLVERARVVLAQFREIGAGTAAATLLALARASGLSRRFGFGRAWRCRAARRRLSRLASTAGPPAVLP